MKRFIIIVLVLVVIGVAFYWGYKNAIKPEQQAQITKTPPKEGIIIVDPGSVPVTALTRETTMVVNLNTPTTIFDSDGSTKKLAVTVQTNPAKSNTTNKSQFLVDMKLTSPGPVMQESTLKIATLDNQQFKLAVTSVVIDGKLNAIDDKQVNLSMKMSTW
ncbi:MAG: hypothetical protein ACE14V_11765 [bacterium]